LRSGIRGLTICRTANFLPSYGLNEMMQRARHRDDARGNSMNARTFFSAILLLVAAPTIASTDIMNATIACDANTGANFASALSTFYSSGKSVLVVELSGGSLCTMANQTYPISGAIFVVINGPGTAAGVIFMPGAAQPVFQVSGGAQLAINNMMFESASNGTVSVTNASLFVDQMAFSSDASSNGGAIAASNSIVKVQRSTFSGNGSTLDGGAIAVMVGGSLAVSDTTFNSNQAESVGIGDGGAIYSNAYR
jgi:predicted outer membrane repeat protein